MAGAVLNDGKTAEEHCRLALDHFNDKIKNFGYHRFPDSKSASRGKRLNMLAAQPSDYLASLAWQLRSQEGTELFQKNQWFVEVKDTAAESRLPIGKIRQYGMLKKFWWAGVTPVVLVYRSKTSDWCLLLENRLFPGQHPFKVYNDPPPKSFIIDDLAPYPSAKAALRDVFGLPRSAME